MHRFRDFGVTLVPVFLALAPASGQEIEVPVASTTSGAFFALSIPDLEASIRWYTEKLGLRVVMRPPKDERAEVAVLEGNGLIVELLQLTDAVPLRQAAPNVSADYLIHGYFKAGIVVEDFDATLEMLRSRGVEIAIGPFPARPGQRANVIVRDNAGNMIQFFGKDVP